MGASKGGVVLFTRSLGRGGAERQLVNLALGLKALGRPVWVRTMWPEGELGAELQAAGVSWADWGWRGKWSGPSFWGQARRELRALAPDWLYVFMPPATLLGSAAAWGLPGLRVAWGIRTSMTDFSDYGWRAGWPYALEARCAAWPDLIVANSEAGREATQARGFGREVAVVPNGLNLEAFRPQPERGQVWRARHGIPQAVPLVGTLCRLDPVKDHPTFLRAVASLVGQHESAHAVVVGGGGAPGYEAQLRALAEGLGLGPRLHWVGNEAQPADAYNAFDLMSLVSYHGEGFPNVLGEALACGVPCVATAVGEAPLVLGPGPHLVPPRAPEALAQAWLAQLAEAPQPERHRERAMAFSVEAMVSKTLRLFDAPEASGR